jgi:hypothetical protein
VDHSDVSGGTIVNGTPVEASSDCDEIRSPLSPVPGNVASSSEQNMAQSNVSKINGSSRLNTAIVM